MISMSGCGSVMAQLQRSCLPIVDQGCCCDLKTCCKVQGWIQVVGSSLSIIAAINDFATTSAICQNVAMAGGDCSTDGRIAATHAIQGINFIAHVIFLAVAILFLAGIHRGEPSKMVHYIRMIWVQLFWSSIFAIVGAVVVTPLFLITFVFLGITVYSLICANSLHILMLADQQGSYIHRV
ncbi:uncharacterized protein LOC117647232 isoform X3 [Thrips palmi]|uniref:Uncharacterized protein LOC117647232 isoform X3 n=1 Tax=Thrips palmi TaxID=161013 RepID=A0A6P8Z3X4_THRPL|nr:uncharacterized protein LOC117647232 isoform X3 [Thrips palmi]